MDKLKQYPHVITRETVMAYPAAVLGGETVQRQGDVLLRQIEQRLVSGKDLMEQGRVILAAGEATGHAHEVIEERLERHLGLNVEVPAAHFFEEPNGRRVLLVERACMLVHQEHHSIQLPPGCYEVILQREWAARGWAI